jgi:hypothetical protein
MTRNYSLDTTAAKEANSGGKRITEPGAYAGKLLAAFGETNANGTESVNFIFEADNGQQIGPLALYTYKGDGTELPSYKMLNAIMACARVRTLDAKPGKVTLYDFDTKAEVTKDKSCYPALVGQRVGLVLQGEEYTNRNGEVKQRMIISAAYCAATRRMAEEVLTSAEEAKALDKYLAWFESNKVKPLRNEGVNRRPSNGAGYGEPPAHHRDDFPSDEITF